MDTNDGTFETMFFEGPIIYKSSAFIPLLPIVYAFFPTPYNNTTMALSVLPPEIILTILEQLPLADLVRAERACRMFQTFCHLEIERRITTGPLKDEWGVLIHLDQALAKPTRFNKATKQVTYSIAMDPVQIKTMYDHRRQIHCQLLRRHKAVYRYHEDFMFTIEKGMSQGHTIDIAAKGAALCQIRGALTRLPSSPDHQPDNKQTIAPPPLTYSLQVTELSLPLSTIAAQ